MRRLHKPGPIDRAKRQVLISDVLRMFGTPIEGMPPEGVALKVWCPLTHEHPEGKQDREMRVYTDNKCYCFICRQMWDTVSLAARMWGCGQTVAARRLLEGMPDEDDLPGQISPAAMVASAVAALGEWADANDVSRFSPRYAKCLEIASAIRQPSDVWAWLENAKNYLRREH